MSSLHHGIDCLQHTRRRTCKSASATAVPIKKSAVMVSAIGRGQPRKNCSAAIWHKSMPVTCRPMIAHENCMYMYAHFTQAMQSCLSLPSALPQATQPYKRAPLTGCAWAVARHVISHVSAKLSCRQLSSKQYVAAQTRRDAPV